MEVGVEEGVDFGLGVLGEFVAAMAVEDADGVGLYTFELFVEISILTGVVGVVLD